MSTKSNSIGIFDSGLGGISILESIINILPNYNYIYLGDAARVPYGNKSQENIYHYTTEALDFLFSQNCDLVIIACNTASSQALRKIQQEYLPKKYPHKKVLGVIKPLVEEIINHPDPIGIIGTTATIQSQTYPTEIQKIKPQATIYQQAAPLLVPLIEEGWINKPETKMILKKYLHPLKTKQIKSLILACTHYPFLYKDIKRIMGENVNIPHPGKIVAESLKNYLNRHQELNIDETSSPSYQFYTTDNPEKFAQQIKSLSSLKADNVSHTNISKL